MLLKKFQNFYRKNYIFNNRNLYKSFSLQNDNMKIGTKPSRIALLIFLSVFLIATLSAFSVTSSVTFTNPETSKTITITNTDPDKNFTFVSPVDFIIIGENDFSVSFKAEGPISLNGIGSLTWTVSSQTPLDYSKFRLGKEYTGILIITSGTESKNVTVKIANTFCDFGNVGGNNIEIVEIRDERLGNSKVWEWAPLDEISIRIRVRNNLDTRERITTAISLYSIKEGIFLELDGKDEELEETIRIDSRDREYFYFKFKLPVVDLVEGDYILFIKAFVDGDESSYCSSAQESVDVEFEDEMIIERLPALIESPCGGYNELSVRIYNLDAGDEEEFRVWLKNSELGINLVSSIYELDEGDYQSIFFSFEIPKNATEKAYTFNMIIEYNYRESTGVFRDSISKSFFVDVKGNCIVQPDILISASLESDAKAGEDLVIRVVLTNTGTAAKTFALDVSGHESWATISEYPETVIISGGDFQEVYIKFNVNKGISGTNTFSIKVYSNNELLATQPFSVNIEPKGFLGITGFPVLEGDAYLWGLGILNIILVVVIIIVAIRIARRKK